MAVDVVIGFDNLTLVLAAGLVLTQCLLVPVAVTGRIVAAENPRLFWRLLAVAVAVLWLTSLAWLWTRTAAMSNQPPLAALAFVPTVLLRTHFGSVWWLRLVALLAVTVTVTTLLPGWRRAGGGERRPGWLGATVLLLGLACIAASRSASGHAAATGDWTLREFMDWLHWLAIATWGGCLLGTLVLVFPRLHAVSPLLRARFAARFSLLATWALLGVLVSGSYSAWHMLPSIAAFWTSHYGNLLGLKLLFVAAMVALGAMNHYRLVPGLADTDAAASLTGTRRLCISVALEAVLLLVVLGVTAVLLGAMPPHG